MECFAKVRTLHPHISHHYLPVDSIKKYPHTTHAIIVMFCKMSSGGQLNWPKRTMFKAYKTMKKTF